MITNYVSIYQVIQEVQVDLGLDEIPVKWADYIRWIDDSLKKVGAYRQNVSRVAQLEIHDYKALLPTGFLYLEEFLEGTQKNDSYGSLPIESDRLPLITDDVDETAFMPLSIYTSNNFRIVDGVIIFGFKEGNVKIRYGSMKVDDNGIPMVPDDPTYREVCTAGVALKLSMRGHKFANPELNSIEKNRAVFNSFKMSARGVANMPTPQKMAQATYYLHSLIPPYFDNLNKFANIKVPENLNL